MDWNNFNNNYSDDDDRRQEEEFRKRNPEIEMENRAKNSWMMWVPFGIVFVVQFALSFIALEFLFTWDAVHFTGDSYMDFANGIMETVSGTTFNLIVSLAYAVICGVLFGIWYRRKFYLPARAAEGDRPRVSVWKKNPLLLAAGVVFLCVGAQYVCVYLMNALALLFPSWLMIYQQLMQGIGLDGGNVGILVALYSMILGPITEELTFRGLTLGYGRRAMPLLGGQCGPGISLRGFAHEPAAVHLHLCLRTDPGICGVSFRQPGAGDCGAYGVQCDRRALPADDCHGK